MALVDVSCKDWQWFKVNSPEWVSVDHPSVRQLREVCLRASELLSIEYIVIEAETFPATLTIQLSPPDNRVYAQAFDARVFDPDTVHTGSDAWRLSELETLKTIRDAILGVLVELNATKIDARPRP